MEWVQLLQQAINYIELHLLEEINYEDVAKNVHMSSYNFHRTFSLMAGMTANEYIRKRRLSIAGQELQRNQCKVIDVALKYGYETPESFAKSFSRFHGVSPKAARKNGTQLCLFNPLMIKITLEGGKIMNYKIVDVPSQKFIARIRSFKNETMNDTTTNEVPAFWNECHDKHLVDEIRNLRKDGKKDLYGLCTPTKRDDNTFDYGIGVIVDCDTESFNEQDLIKKGFSIWNVELATYVVFKCYGTDETCIREMWQKFYKEFLPQSGYKETDKTDYEVYYEKGEPGLFCEIYIPVEKL